ncbi:MAG: EndoU domain-containing protein [Saprospiraceae bacterium]|nr:EndoU domain-containing protein [Saprospiraceae bacterium]MBP7699820.1 EndoU domain-containing protein [Saprospiraceae bacterium]
MTPDKDFFPDEWGESKIITEIKYAWPNKTYINQQTDPYAFWGYMSNGQRIKIVLNQDGSIKTCFPQ